MARRDPSTGPFVMPVEHQGAVPCNRCESSPWDSYGPGEYVGHGRSAHVPVYRLRVDDQLEFVYRLTRVESSQPYELNVGDEIKVECLADPGLNRDHLVIQPDGTIILKLLGSVRAAGRTAVELRDDLERLYFNYLQQHDTITVTPERINTKLEDLRAAVAGQNGFNGQRQQVRVTPDGTLALPGVGSVPVQGLTLAEVEQEMNARYASVVDGIEVTPLLVQRAPRHIYVLGEVRTPGRYTLEGPTTSMQAIALAGGWNVGANTFQVVVFRRDDDWRLMATMLNLRAPLYGNDQAPRDEIWLNDSDIVIIPKCKILVFDEWVDLVMNRGLYGLMPGAGNNISFGKLTGI